MATTIDLKAYPRLAAFIASLPAGLSSYPEVQGRASMCRSYLEDKRIVASPGMPPELLAMIKSPPSFASWVPLAHFHALVLGGADLLKLNEPEFVEWVYQTNRRMFQNIAFKILMSFFSPAALIDMGANRWSALHRGSVLTFLETKTGTATVKLTYPGKLFGGPMLRAYSASFRAALENTRANDVSVQVISEKEGEGIFRATWR